MNPFLESNYNKTLFLNSRPNFWFNSPPGITKSSLSSAIFSSAQKIFFNVFSAIKIRSSEMLAYKFGIIYKSNNCKFNKYSIFDYSSTNSAQISINWMQARLSCY